MKTKTTPKSAKEAQELCEDIVKYQASRYQFACGRSIDMDDLLQEGRIAAEIARKKHDDDKGAGFRGYAGQWIWAKIARHTKTMSRSVTLPARLSRDARNLSFKSVPTHDHESGECLMHHYGIIDENHVDEQFCPIDVKNLTNEALTILSSRERQIVNMIFFKDMTLDQAGRELVPKVSRERVRQILERSLRRMKNKIKHNK